MPFSPPSVIRTEIAQGWIGCTFGLLAAWCDFCLGTPRSCSFLFPVVTRGINTRGLGFRNYQNNNEPGKEYQRTLKPWTQHLEMKEIIWFFKNYCTVYIISLKGEGLGQSRACLASTRPVFNPKNQVKKKKKGIHSYSYCFLFVILVLGAWRQVDSLEFAGQGA